MEDITCKFLVLGKTGAGKSSLINYLSGRDDCETGTGLPVTQKGVWKSVVFDNPFGEGKLELMDSWGLEAGQADTWQTEVLDKLAPTLEFEDMIFGVLYCLSYQNNRIQDVDIQSIQDIVRRGHNVIIVLTQGDVRNREELYPQYVGHLKNALGEENLKYVIETSTGSAPKIGQSKGSEPFGREKLVEVMDSEFKINHKEFVKYQHDVWLQFAIEEIAALEENLDFERDKMRDDAKIFEPEDAFNAASKECAKLTKACVKKLSARLVKTQAKISLSNQFSDTLAKPPQPRNIFEQIGNFFHELWHTFIDRDNVHGQRDRLNHAIRKLDYQIETAIDTLNDKIHKAYSDALELEGMEPTPQQNGKPAILLLGETGSGKSSIVNYLADKNVAKTDDTKSCTKGIAIYDVGDIALIDSEGYEVGWSQSEIEHNFLQTLESANKLTGNTAGVWYVISGIGKRIQEIDQELITFLNRQIPVAVVISKIDEMTPIELKKMKDAVNMKGILVFGISAKSGTQELIKYSDWKKLEDWTNKVTSSV